MKIRLRSLLPFSNAHWSLRLILWLALAYVFVGDQCAEGPRYLSVALLTAMVCIALWNSHIREIPIASWKSRAMVLAGALHDLLLLSLWVFPVFFFVPAYYCYNTRVKIQELFSLAAPLVSEVEDRAKQHGSIADSGTGLKIPQGRYLSGGIVSKDGAIIEISENPPAVVMLVPEYSSGAVTWKCTGFPKKSMPVDCRD